MPCRAQVLEKLRRGSDRRGNPRIDSSLSSVPPEKLSPRPDILATGMPSAATSGATTSVVLSPTPPLECLSTTQGATALRSSVSPGAYHGHGQVDRLAPVHAAQHHGHQPGRHLVVGDASVHKALHKGVDLGLRSSPPSRFFVMTSTGRIKSQTSRVTLWKTTAPRAIIA